MRKIVVFLVFLSVSNGWLCCQESDWDKLVDKFSVAYGELGISPLRIAFADNMDGIQDNEGLAQQALLFQQLRSSLLATERERLSFKQQLEYDLLWYQLALNEERIKLEKEWWQEPSQVLFREGLAKLPNGQAWYAYFLKRWLDVSVTPEEMYAFGMQEVDKVLKAMKAIQIQSGMDSVAFHHHINSEQFFYTEQAEVQAAFEAFSAEMLKVLPAFFPEMDKIPAVGIALSFDERLAQVPGYYRDNTFFYNFFGNAFNKREVRWFFLHEAIPGHHYEVSYSRMHTLSPVQRLFNNPGYSEGWAAYVEEIGNEIGAYKDIYDELGKWEWDIIRSVRVPLDVGLNYYGWSDEEALSFWQKYISGKDNIAEREIARMRRWPCQVITYKYGADKIMGWKAELSKQVDFDLKQFHTALLQYGPLPFSLLEQRLFAAVE